ncbi:single-stranded-DNA-specific exonuclease C-terminal domain-containing protein [Virgibacillus halophilus]|uniref:Single-stranded-DNA-specific exonuclease C-terminal domain-containing protein n=1 Tax=Tigheibacillus halophilus TaxID=361280 RepID=A0ABU5CBX4_9BACI|nr:single-stranded-DNA-specific exonuclease C-terminal domain-containing protein [Virgibacillus halophilus]
MNKQNIQFMLRVFLELDFVKLENGIITLLEKPHKKGFNFFFALPTTKESNGCGEDTLLFHL